MTPLQFAMAVTIVALPVLFLERTGEERWAGRYVALILLMFVVTHWAGLVRFAAFVRRELGR